MKSLALVCALLAQDAAPTRTPPDWSPEPWQFDIRPILNRYGPDGFEGLLTLRVRCLITAEGAATSCSVLEQSYPDFDFLPLVNALSTNFVFRPATEGGRPVSAWLTIPLRFNLWGDEPRPRRRSR